MNEVDIHIARKLKERRLELGLSQSDIAKFFGFNRSTIAQIEMGRNKLNHNTLSKFAEIYQRPVSYFIGDEDLYLKNQIISDNKPKIEEIVAEWKIKDYLTRKEIAEPFIKDLQESLQYLCELYNVKIEDIW